MQLKHLAPMLYTGDIEETVNFYVQQLGFHCNNSDPENGWAALQYGDIRIMLSRPDTHQYFEHPFFTGSFYFTVENVDGLWDKLRESVMVCYPPEDFEYGMREFAVYDNNGYLLQFGQPIAKTQE